QAPVLYKQQAHRDDRWHIFEGFVVLMRVTVRVKRFATAVVDGQPGLGLFRIGHEKAVADIALQGRGKANLLLNIETPLAQPLKKRRERCVAQTSVERARLGKSDRATGAGLKLLVEIRRVTRQPKRLQL